MFNNRLKKIIKESKLTIVEFAKKTGVSKNSVINYRDGNRSPDTKFIRAVCLNFGVSAEWLLFGKGAAYKEATNKSLSKNGEKNSIEIEQFINDENKLKNKFHEEIFLWNHYQNWVVKFIDDAILESGINPDIIGQVAKNRLIAVVKDELEINLKGRVIDLLRNLDK